jgi:hypothetical protein
MRALLAGATATLSAVVLSTAAYAQPAAPDTGRAPAERFSDPTGGAYTSPTPLFTPAAALPAWMPRLTLGADVQPAGRLDPVRPFFTAELGLGRGFTVAAGTQWLGGEPPRLGDAIAPFAQVRYQLAGRADGLGWLASAAVTYKRVGYLGGENMAEASASLQYRARFVEAGVQGAFGQSLSDAGVRNLEARAYAALRPVAALALGVSAQVRGDVGDDEAPDEVQGRNDIDFVAGGTVSVTVSRWQFGALVGATSLGLVQQVAFAAQGQAQVRF